MNKLPDEIIVLALRAASGSITKSMRMVAFSYTGNEVLFRFYMDEEPSDDERELGDIACLNFEVGHPTKLTNSKVEFVITKEPLGYLDSLDFRIFSRWED